MSRYLVSLAEQCKEAIRDELGIYSSCNTVRGSHICDVWISDEDKEAFEKAFIEGDAGKKYGLWCTLSYDLFGKRNNTYAMSRIRR